MVNDSGWISRCGSTPVVAISMTVLGVLLDDGHSLFHHVKLAQNLLQNRLREKIKWISNESTFNPFKLYTV
jgi:hypothetical protein